MKRACVIGWPIAHSRSPLIHGYWLRKYGIAGGYDKRPIRPEEVVQFLQTMGQQGLVGCNVTLPHKEAAYAAADVVYPAARAVGVANTLWYDGEKLVADNTDGIGFMNHLRASVPDFVLQDNIASVLGAGGGARAIIGALLEAGAREVRVFNRTRDRAESIARHFGNRVTPYPWSERAKRSRNVGILINTTSLGMQGGSPLEMDVSVLDPHTIVADIVYVPLVTPLLAAADNRGLRTVDGLGMLLHQAVQGFERWFGVRPEVDAELRALVVADLEGR